MTSVDTITSGKATALPEVFFTVKINRLHDLQTGVAIASCGTAKSCAARRLVKELSARRLPNRRRTQLRLLLLCATAALLALLDLTTLGCGEIGTVGPSLAGNWPVLCRLLNCAVIRGFCGVPLAFFT